MGARMPLACCLLLSILVSVAGWHGPAWDSDKLDHNGVPYYWDIPGYDINGYTVYNTTCILAELTAPTRDMMVIAMTEPQRRRWYDTSTSDDWTVPEVYAEVGCGDIAAYANEWDASTSVSSCTVNLENLDPKQEYYIFILNTNDELLSVTDTVYDDTWGCQKNGLVTSEANTPPVATPPSTNDAPRLSMSVYYVGALCMFAALLLQ